MTHIGLIVWHLDRLGGMERHVTDLAIALHRTGRRVSVFVETPLTEPNEYAAQLRHAGIPVLVQPAHSFAFHKFARARWNLWLTGQIRTHKITVLHIHNCRLGQSWLLPWAERHGLPAVYTEHTAIADYGGPLLPPANARSANALACVSGHARQQLQALLPQPIAIVRHIVHAAPPAPIEPGLILCPVRLERYKGVDILLRALPKNANLIIAGDGSERRSLEALATPNVTFAGAVPPSAMPALFARAEVVVLPSRAEGLPLSLLEAMAAGKPSVATAAGGIPELIRHRENGLLVPPEDPQALNAALTELIEDPALRLRLGAAARQTFDESRNDESSIVADTLALYDTPRVTRITPASPGPSSNWQALWAYRDLFLLLLQRDVKLRFGKSHAGLLWAVLQPLLILAVLTLFAAVARIQTTAIPYPLYAITGLLPWTYFTQSVTQSTHCLVNYAALIGKLHFPRLILPLAVAGTALIDLAIAATVLPLFFIYYGVPPTLRLLALPGLILLAVAAAVGLGLWLAVLNVRTRRVAHLVPLLLQLLFFATPIAYSTALVPAAWRPWVGLNPIAGVVDGFRWALLPGQPQPETLPASIVVIALTLLSGLRLFQRKEPAFADEL